MRLPVEYNVVTGAASPAEALDGDERDTTRNSVDWGRVERLARWHRLEPLLWRSLSRGPAFAPPTWERLHAAYLDNAARNLYIQVELATVLAALESAGVPAMLLKGAALIEDVYPDPALRVMCDLDILVGARDLELAQTAIAAIGYSPGAVLHNQGSQEWMAEHHHHYPALISPERIVAVELHQHLVPPGDPAHFDISGFWARARPSTVGPAHLLPAPEDLLVHVALHFARNRLWRSDGALGQVADVAWILDRHVLDWDPLVERAQAYDLGGSLFLALFAAGELLGAVVPSSAMDALRPGTWAWTWPRTAGSARSTGLSQLSRRSGPTLGPEMADCSRPHRLFRRPTDLVEIPLGGQPVAGVCWTRPVHPTTEGNGPSGDKWT